MKYLRLYDLRNETVTVIPYSRNSMIAESEPKNVNGKKRKISRYMIRRVKQAAFSAVEFAGTLASGIVFLHFVSERLRELRGYDAVGSEYFAAAFVALFVLWIFERVRFWLWTREL